VASAARRRFGSSAESAEEKGNQKRRRRFALPAHSTLAPTFVAAVIFSAAFAIVLAPWTIRNARVFHLFQPLAPAHAEMPGEFVARGYLRWLRTWVDDQRYIAPLLWSMDSEPIAMDDIPDSAFDSDQERARVKALFDQYNHPPDEPNSHEDTVAPEPENPNVPEEPEEKNSNETSGNAEDPGEENDNEAEPTDEEKDQEPQSVEMTPAVDAGFAQLAQERVARHPFNYYFWLPVRRAVALWFDTHSQYYPFEGELLPLDDLDHETYQHLWLPFFAGLMWFYTLLGALGGWFLWRSRDVAGRRWLMLAALVIFLRLAFFSTIENPEPRYVVEIFPFLAALGGIAISNLKVLSRPAPKKARG
jgi:hypothetical protein